MTSTSRTSASSARSARSPTRSCARCTRACARAEPRCATSTSSNGTRPPRTRPPGTCQGSDPRQVPSGHHCPVALGKPVLAHLRPDVVARSADALGLRVPIVAATADTLGDALRPLVADAELRRNLGTESRTYVEQVHDIDRVADRLLAVYRSL